MESNPRFHTKEEAYRLLGEPLRYVLSDWKAFCLEQERLEQALESGLVSLRLNTSETFSDRTIEERLTDMKNKFPAVADLLENPRIIVAALRIRNLADGANYPLPIDSYEAIQSDGIRLLMATFVVLKTLTKDYVLQNESYLNEVYQENQNAFSLTDVQQPSLILIDNIQTGADVLMIMSYARNQQPEEIAAIMQALQSRAESAVPPIRRLGSAAFSLWAEMRENGIFPQPLEEGGYQITQEFRQFLRQSQQDVDAYHGGCPATGYLEDFLEVFSTIYERLRELTE